VLLVLLACAPAPRAILVVLDGGVDFTLGCLGLCEVFVVWMGWDGWARMDGMGWMGWDEIEYHTDNMMLRWGHIPSDEMRWVDEYVGKIGSRLETVQLVLLIRRLAGWLARSIAGR
jgi:hypothetical protein